MKKHTSRMVLIIALAAMFSLVPVAVHAEETDAKQEGVTTEQTEFKTVCAPALDSEADNEELLVEYMEDAVSISSEPKNSVYGYTHLTGLDRTMYEVLRRKLEEVANGTTTSSVITVSVAELGLDRPFTAAELGLTTVMNGNSLSTAAQTALYKILRSFDFSKLHNALLFDCPASLYWYDKTEGVSYRSSYGFKQVTDSATGKPAIAFTDSTSYTFSFYVAAEFSASQRIKTYETDAEKIQSVQTAIETAQGIVEAAAGETDTGKLRIYKETICERVSYNHDAVDESNDVPYGNPWQLIWVFDEDPETNVVCEGYSKAFQFLCDVSEFADPDIQSRIVTGDLDGGGHMWNVLTAGNGKNYLVDVTNCDEGTIGSPNKLFLAQYTRAVNNGYYFSCGYGGITYLYDEDTLGFYNAAELAITDFPYVDCEGKHTEVTDAAVAPTCTKTGLTAGSHCSVCRKELTAQKTVPANGHTEVTDPAVPATCTETGLSEGKHCSVCNAVLTAQKTVREKGHTEVTDPAVPATCTESGLTEGTHCSKCNTTLHAQETVPATGHMEVIDEAVEPTCTESGLTEGTHCSKCNTTLRKQKTVPAAGHTEEIDAAVAATYEAAGLTEGSHCAVCGEVLEAQTVIPKLRRLSNGAKVLLSGQAYLVTKTAAGSAQGTVTFTKANNAKSVSVPKTVKLPDGKTYQVTAVAASAFTGSKIRTVTIPANIKQLRAGAFKGSRASTLIIKSKHLTKSRIKNCLKGSHIKTVRVKIGSKKTNRKYVKKYKKIFTKKNAGKAVKVK